MTEFTGNWFDSGCYHHTLPEQFRHSFLRPAPRGVSLAHVTLEMGRSEPFGTFRVFLAEEIGRMNVREKGNSGYFGVVNVSRLVASKGVRARGTFRVFLAEGAKGTVFIPVGEGAKGTVFIPVADLVEAVRIESP